MGQDTEGRVGDALAAFQEGPPACRRQGGKPPFCVNDLVEVFLPLTEKLGVGKGKTLIAFFIAILVK